MRENSIHPRAMFGESGEKLNTCKPRTQKKIDRTAAAIEAHLVGHPRDGMSATRLAALRSERGA